MDDGAVMSVATPRPCWAWRRRARIAMPATAGARTLASLMALVLSGVASPAVRAQTYILDERFTQTATPTTATPIIRVVGGYTGPGGITYTADAYWANQDCNGLLSAWNQSATDVGGLPGSQCGSPPGNRYGWNFVQQLAQALGQLNGQTLAQARNNFAVSAYTLAGSAAAGGIELQSSQVPMNVPPGGTGRFVMFSVDVAAANCTAPGNTLLQFYLLNAANAQTAVGDPINACSSSTTFTAEAKGTLPATSHRAGRYSTSTALLHLGSTVGVRLRNMTVFSSGNGNDHAFDNIRIIDATPTVGKAFASGSAVVGQPVTLTFTVTNTPDNLQKQGWSFVDTLPAGLVVATPNAVSSTCTGSSVSAPAGGATISITNGTLPAGATCAIQVNVTSLTPGTYTNGADNLSPTTGLNLPPVPATLTVVPATLLRLQKALPQGRRDAADQFTLSIAGAGAATAVTTTGSGNTATGVATQADATPGSTYTLSEAMSGGTAPGDFYAVTYACTNARAGGQAPSGTGATFDIVPVAGDDLTCTFTNTLRQADISVDKTAATNPVQSGGVVTYTIVVNNHGPGAADGTVLTDTPGVGLNCTAPGVTFICSATDGATCPSSTVPVSTLLGSGMAIPTLPVGGRVTATVQCTVVATGSP